MKHSLLTAMIVNHIHEDEFHPLSLLIDEAKQTLDLDTLGDPRFNLFQNPIDLYDLQ